jgi:3-isopropylmalate/(R)-2-methylmalate dehydratase small subunit
MDPVKIVSGTVCALDRKNVDTDQIIPAVHLKRIERTGYGQFLFESWRTDPEFALNRPEFAGASILVAGDNFGCGSSREHAAWALHDYGFRAVIAPSLGDIFRNNAGKNGLLAITLPEADVRELIESAPAVATVDLEREVVVLPSSREVPFAIDAGLRHRLLNGLDDIALTMQRVAEIDDYEAQRERLGPSTLLLG